MPSERSLSDSEKLLIINYHKNGESSRQIAAKLNRSKSGIQSVIKKFTSSNEISRKKGSGRPPKYDLDYKNQIVNYFIENPFKTHLQCQQMLNLTCSSSFITTTLQHHGINSYVAKNKKALKEEHFGKR